MTMNQAKQMITKVAIWWLVRVAKAMAKEKAITIAKNVDTSILNRIAKREVLKGFPRLKGGEK